MKSLSTKMAPEQSRRRKYCIQGSIMQRFILRDNKEIRKFLPGCFTLIRRARGGLIQSYLISFMKYLRAQF
jgi:hypothetical protein